LLYQARRLGNDLDGDATSAWVEGRHISDPVGLRSAPTWRRVAPDSAAWENARH
jgi:hypothetical protein